MVTLAFVFRGEVEGVQGAHTKKHVLSPAKSTMYGWVEPRKKELAIRCAALYAEHTIDKAGAVEVPEQ